ncbi:uncharacterized protein LOC123692562 [Colias croceus]|uniref:uncharacterized protein LOC123692562 n=1 Tax=Colias crocea TaxID=72248 RepID=UPI001E27C88D|nr:uncharacterized protein LOC123692562 [Colias croceus]
MSNIEQLIKELRIDIKNDSEESLKKVEQRITNKINENIDSKFKTIQEDIEKLKKTNTENEYRLLEIEKCMRIRNLTFFGIQEQEKSYEDLEKNILNLITSDMNINCHKTELQFIKRLGKRTENKIRPVIVTFSTFGKKLCIMKMKHNLKDKNIYIKEDFPPKILEIRKKLQEQLHKERESGEHDSNKKQQIAKKNKVRSYPSQSNQYSIKNYITNKNKSLLLPKPTTSISSDSE